jgi:predicted RNA-binding Zn-ribbon protein involved in translation (DUF1610 family)
MEKIMTNFEVQDFLKAFEVDSETFILEEGKEKSELEKVAEARGMKIKGSRDLAIFKTIYAFTDKANANGAILPRKDLLRVLPQIIGKPININHNRRFIVGHYIDYKYRQKDHQVIAYGVFYKSAFMKEWTEAQALFKKKKLSSSFEIWSPGDKREDVGKGKYKLHQMEIAGGALIYEDKDNEPAFKDAKVLSLAKKEPELVYASKYNENEIITSDKDYFKDSVRENWEKMKEERRKQEEQKPKDVTCSNCEHKMQYSPLMKEPYLKCTKCLAVINKEGAMVYPPQIIDFKVACPNCNVQNWLLMSKEEKGAKVKCLGCEKDFNIMFEFLKSKDAIEKVGFVYTGTARCIQCGRSIPFTCLSTQDKKEIKCERCNISFTHEIKKDVSKKVSKIEEIVEKPKEEPKSEEKEEKKVEEKKVEEKVEKKEEVKVEPKEKEKEEVKAEEPKKEEPKVEEKKEEPKPKAEETPKEEKPKEETPIEETPKEEIEKKEKSSEGGDKTDATLSKDLGESEKVAKESSQEKMEKEEIKKDDVVKEKIVEAKEQPEVKETPTDDKVESKTEDAPKTEETVTETKTEPVPEAELTVNEEKAPESRFEYILEEAEEDLEESQNFNCSCVECGHKITTEEHCSTLKCPKCGGQMRRAERPGNGKPEEKSERLTYQQRKALPDRMFAVIVKVKDKRTGKMRKVRMYPINDKAHVRNALARLGQPRPKATLKKLGVSIEAVRARILRRARQLKMTSLLKRYKSAMKNLADKYIELKKRFDKETAFYKDNAKKVLLRREELGEEFSVDLTDEDIVNDEKFEHAKLIKENALLKAEKEKEKEDLIVGDKTNEKDNEYYAENKKKIDAKAFGKRK